MKRSVAILFLTVCFLPLLRGQDSRYGQEPPRAKQGIDFPIKVHVSGMHIGSHCTSFAGHALCQDVIYSNAVLNGEKIELMGDSEFFPGYPVRLLPGDYQARLVKDAHKVDDSPLFQKYELIFADRTVWRSTVTGISE